MRRYPMLAGPLVVAAVAVGGCATPGQNDLGAGAGAGAAPTASITARGTGEVTGTPDIASVDLGVATQAPSAQAALEANNQQAAAVLAQLKGKGVADKDLRTSGLSINPTFANDTGRITGYAVTNEVTVTIRDIAAAGGIIDAAAQAAGDAVRVQQLSFGIDDDSALRATARADAVHRAQDQARQLADAAGVPLGAIRSITEVSAGAQPPPTAAPVADSVAARVAVQPGTQQLSSTVEVVYAIG